MKSTLRVCTFIALSAVLFQGCAHTADKKLDQKLSEQGQVKDGDDLTTQIESTISSAPGLTDDQKAKLKAIRKSTHEQMDQAHEESLRLRAVLVKDLVASPYDAKEVALIKKRIKKAEDTRLSALFSGIDQAQKVLGHTAAQNQNILNQFLEDRGHQR
jgi:Spy/CpxP family protein refolding chaperone